MTFILEVYNINIVVGPKAIPTRSRVPLRNGAISIHSFDSVSASSAASAYVFTNDHLAHPRFLMWNRKKKKRERTAELEKNERERERV